MRQPGPAVLHPLSSRGTCTQRRMILVVAPPSLPTPPSQKARARTGGADGLTDVMGGDSSSHFSVPITSSIWGCEGK